MAFKRLSIIFFLLPLFLNASQVQYQAPISQDELDRMDIEHYFRDKEIKLLKAGEEEFLTLVKEENTGFPKGIALIVPEMAQSVLRQAAVSNLYDNLNDYGWTSLLLTMPSRLEPKAPEQNSENQSAGDQSANSNDTDSQPPQTATDSQQSNDEDKQGETNQDGTQQDEDPNLTLKAFHRDPIYSETMIEHIEQQMTERLNAGWELAGNYPGFFLVICDGKSCGWLASLYAKGKLPIPDAMVMLSAHLPEQALNDDFAVNLSQTEFPVLDLYQTLDNKWVTTSIKQRRLMSRKNFKTDYRQRKLHSSFHFQGQGKRTIKEIYGFLTAVGM